MASNDAGSPMASNDYGLLRAYGQPAGYYPGGAVEFSPVWPDYRAWQAKNQTGFDEIQRRIVESHEGSRAPGCIGEDKYICVATLAQKLAIGDDAYFNVFPEIKYDVNGKPVGGSQILFYGFPPNAKAEGRWDSIENRTVFQLKLGSDGKVKSLWADLPRSPFLARTQEEYDATNVYETVASVTAKNCPTLTRAEVAKWVENTIKPSSRAGAIKHWSGPERGHAQSIRSRKTVLCGRAFVFVESFGSSSEGSRHEHFEGMDVGVE